MSSAYQQLERAALQIHADRAAVYDRAESERCARGNLRRQRGESIIEHDVVRANLLCDTDPGRDSDRFLLQVSRIMADAYAQCELVGSW